MHLLIRLAPLAALLSSNIALAQDVTTGTLQYDDQPALTIPHAIAREYLIPEELRANPDGNHRLHILLSDQVATSQAAENEGAFLGEVQDRGMRGIYLEITLPERKWSRVSVSRPNGEIEGTGMGLEGSEFSLSELSLEGDVVSGRVRTILPQELPDWGDGPTRYTFDVRFHAPITRAPVPTERLSGLAARNSPQAAALVALAELLASNDIARVRAGLHPRLPFAEAMRASEPEARQALTEVRDYIGSPDKLSASIEHVLVYGERAVVVTQTGRFVVERENGAWVVASQDQPYR
jgi:hypothetical protein